MRVHRPEVVEVFRRYGEAYEAIHGVSSAQKKVLKDLSLCRTATLGGHKKRCDRCGHEEISYNSCRNRHCPKCQASGRARWLEAKEQDLLDVPYFHVVFTLPDPLAPLALQNKRQLYGLLFRAASESLQILARDSKHLGAQIGFLAVLHTWGQNLHHHPHLHCVVPGGGISLDGKRWVSCREGFFLPVRALSRIFRRRFLVLLNEARRSRQMVFCGKIKSLAGPRAWKSFVSGLWSREWVVYAKPPFGGPVQVLKYLARYTHRVAISNSRLLSIEEGKVSFRWKDYRQGREERTLTLDAVEFIRRFLLHYLPRGFVRIRSYGFLANRVRRDRLEHIRQLLQAASEPSGSIGQSTSLSRSESRSNEWEDACPACRNGRLVVVEKLARTDLSKGIDSS